MAYKILYIANKPEVDGPLGCCPNYMWISKSFEELGHEIDVYNEADLIPRQVVALSKSKDYDFILTEEARLAGDFKHDEERDKDILQKLFKDVMINVKMPIVAWLTNIFFSVYRREIQVKTNPIFKSDVVFTTDGGHDKEFKEAGVNHRLLRQGIYEPEAYISEEKYPTEAQIGFIGAVYENIWPYRKELVDFLTNEYRSKFHHFGERGDIRHDPLNRLVSTLKIVVGDSVESPKYWSNRIYEMLGRGAFLIHPMIEGLDKEFTPYKHFIPYKYGDFKGLKEKIDYFLKNKKERDEIRQAGLEHCKKHHTYKIRVAQLIKTLEDEDIIKKK